MPWSGTWVRLATWGASLVLWCEIILGPLARRARQLLPVHVASFRPRNRPHITKLRCTVLYPDL